MTKRLSLGGRLRMAAACPDANAQLLAESADAIEQHEAFRQEVSDVVKKYFSMDWNTHNMVSDLHRFIIPKPDPLVEAFDAVWPGIDRTMVKAIRAALEARGLEIREKGQ